MNQTASIRFALGSLCLTGLFLACSSPESPSAGGTGAAGGAGGAGGAGATAGSPMGTGGGTGGSTTGGAMGSGGAGAAGGAGGAGGTGGVGGGTGGSTTGGTGGGTGGSTTGGAGGAGGGTGGSTTGGTAGAPTGGSSGAGTGGSGTGGTGQQGNCNFSIMGQTADKAGQGGIPTVGVVTWSVDNPSLTAASIDFSLAGGATLTAPVDVTKGPNFRTLLLGMKGSKTYTYRIKVTGANGACTSPDQMITTGAVTSDVPRIARTAGPAAASQAKGFIVTSTGIGSMGGGFMGGGGGGASVAFILDADGDPVWWTTAPTSCSRAKMSFDGQYMWMVNLNVQNGTKDGGEVARISMDGLTRNSKIPGLSNCHHDITILPDGRVACLSWIQQPGDQPSDLIESDYQGTIKKIVTLDSNIYAGGTGVGGGTGTYHANAIHYHMADDSYTFSDRNPNLFMKVNRKGEPLWQFGGSCTGAKAPKCVAGDWKVNHGHDMLDDGTFLFFNNGQSGASTAFFYKLAETGTFTATQTGKYSPGTTSNVLGDVQRLPNGNTLVTFSTASKIDEIDASGAVVQSITGPGGYAEWRETLYGPPPRF